MELKNPEMRVVDLLNALKEMPRDALVRVGPIDSFDEYRTIHAVVAIDLSRVWLIGSKP